MPRATRSSTRASRSTRDASTLVLDAVPWAGAGEVGTVVAIRFDKGKSFERWYTATIFDFDPTFGGIYHLRFEDDEVAKEDAKSLMMDVYNGDLKIVERQKVDFA